jgi:fengycin family lipopeptide synthetase D
VESRLVEICQELFGYEKIGTRDNFFELGGNSLTIIKLISDIHKKFDAKIRIQDVFDKENLYELAGHIKNVEKEMYFSIKAIEKKEYYVLSPAQKRLYILQQMNPVSIGYNLPRTIDLQSDIDMEKMEIAFKKLIQRQESLRTSFQMCKEKPVQVIHDSDKINFRIEYFQLNDQNESREKDAEILQITDNFIRPFDLGKAPLVRVGLVKTRRRSVLIIDMHHIISDPVSEEVLAEEIIAIINRETVPGLFLQYKDYAEWQNSDMQQEQVKKEEEFWLKEFSGDLPVLNLPADYPRPPFRSFSGNIVYYTLSETETREIRNFAKSNNATIYMTLLSIYFILLYKISGDEDIIVGTPITSRRHADLERIVGMFVNTLAIRGYPGGNKLFSRFFYEIKNKILAVFENQQFQFEDLVEKAAVGRDVSRSPIFDVMFNLLTQEGFEGESANNPEEGVGIHLKGTSKFDMSWYAFDSTGTICFNIEYCNKLYTPAAIDRYFKYFRTLLAGLSTGTETKISQLEILSPEEKKQMIHDFNHTMTGGQTGKALQRLFEEQVEKNPGRAAVVNYHRTLTYRELNARANQLAKLLRKKGAAPGTIMAIEMERSLEMIIGLLAILKAGSAFLPIDTLYTAETKHYMVKDSSVPAALVRDPSPGPHTETFAELPPGNIIDVIIMENTVYPGDHTNPDSSPGDRPDAPACVIYTPGTTGRPNGVILEHRNLLTYLDAMYRAIEITSDQTIIQQASFSFYACLEEVFPLLLKGGKIAVPRDEELTNIHLLAEFIIKNNVDMISCWPRRLKELNRLNRETPLQIIISSGDVLKGQYIHRLLESGKVYNRYGSVETAGGATWFYLDFPADEPLPHIPIGKPLFNYNAYILDQYHQLLPGGIPGELYIAGPGISRGYLNRPALTAQRFLHISHLSHMSHMSYIYKTGDLARRLPDGNFEFLGRRDDQVKIRGYRINPAQIENQLLKKEEIKETIVLPGKDKNRGPYLCAYMAVEEPLNKILLREFLLKSLPAYMYPAYFVELEEFPLNPGGKIRRLALPAPGTADHDRFVAPKHYYEIKMVEVCAEILKIDKDLISLNDNFFDLGGNSLQVINMISKIQEIFNVTVPVLNVFENATINNISKYIFMKETLEVRLYSTFNKDKPRKIFCFPPGIGYGLIYSELSMYFKDYTFYAFNFIKDDDIIKRYVDVIIDAVNGEGADTSIILMAYSQGGKTSFKVTEKLESLGHHVSDIILFDCVIPVDYRDSLIKKFEMNLEVGAKILESLLNEAGMGYMLEQVQFHRKEYLKFHIGLSNFKPVNANIHLIASQERNEILEKFSESRLIGFDQLTNNTYKVYKGFGTHDLMLGGEYLHKNIKLLKNILLELQ